MKWWMREDWRERVIIGVAAFITIVGIAELVFGSGPIRWVLLVAGLLGLVSGVLRLRQQHAREYTSIDGHEDERADGERE